jgi:hypothetical protein
MSIFEAVLPPNPEDATLAVGVPHSWHTHRCCDCGAQIRCACTRIDDPLNQLRLCRDCARREREVLNAQEPRNKRRFR